jgi:rubrerythrin
MDDLKPQILRSFRMEMIGTACYENLSKQYSVRLPEISKTFSQFSGHESMHGRLFKKCYKDLYGEEIRGEKFWLFIGKLSALSQILLPLKIKLKILSVVERQAVAQIEEALASGMKSGFHTILKTILPDEKAHAGLYAAWFTMVKK